MIALPEDRIAVMVKSGKNEGLPAHIVRYSVKGNGYELEFPYNVFGRSPRKLYYSLDRLKFYSLADHYKALCMNPNIGRKKSEKIAQLVAAELMKTNKPAVKIGGAYGMSPRTISHATPYDFSKYYDQLAKGGLKDDE